MAYNKIYFAKKPNILNFIKFGQIALVSKTLNEMIKKNINFVVKKKFFRPLETGWKLNNSGMTQPQGNRRCTIAPFRRP